MQSEFRQEDQNRLRDAFYQRSTRAAPLSALRGAAQLRRRSFLNTHAVPARERLLIITGRARGE